MIFIYNKDIENYNSDTLGKERNDTITYDEGFYTEEKVFVDRNRFENREDEIEQNYGKKEDLQGKKGRKEEKARGSKLIVFQLILCLIIAIAVFLLKTTDCDFYRDFVKWYNAEQENTLISSDKMKNFDLNTLFSKATSDSAYRSDIASNDEI